jgi:hypothetical protein
MPDGWVGIAQPAAEPLECRGQLQQDGHRVADRNTLAEEKVSNPDPDRAGIRRLQSEIAAEPTDIAAAVVQGEQERPGQPGKLRGRAEPLIQFVNQRTEVRQPTAQTGER